MRSSAMRLERVGNFSPHLYLVQDFSFVLSQASCVNASCQCYKFIDTIDQRTDEVLVAGEGNRMPGIELPIVLPSTKAILLDVTVMF